MLDQSIIDLNTKFYHKTAKEFSLSRQYPWKGWTRVLESIEAAFDESDRVSVLDLGCGNGRFYRYINQKCKKPTIVYLGVDNNDSFLKECRSNFPTQKFENCDIFNGLTNVKKTFDIVCGFGITHHIPQANLTDWLKEVITLTKEDGLIILTFWQPKKELEYKTYFWNGDKTAKRYVEVYSREYVVELLAREFNNIEVIDDFEHDRSNVYFVLKVVTRSVRNAI